MHPTSRFVPSLFLVLQASASPGLAQSSLPREPIHKPAHTQVAPYHEPGLVALQLRAGLRVQLAGESLSDLGTGDLSAAQDVLRGSARGRWQRTHRIADADLDRLRTRAERNLGHALPDPRLEFRVQLDPGLDESAAIDALNALPIVELAWPVGRPAPPPSAPDFTSLQGYVEPAPAGIGAKPAWHLPGGTGSPVRVCDIEYEFLATHVDLPPIPTVGPSPALSGFGTDHATAVLGELFAKADGAGVRGAAHAAHPLFAAAYTSVGWNVSAAITTALLALQPGDVLLLEQQMVGPHGGAAYVPVEWDLSVYGAIQLAVGNGVTVVEAAGNGFENLDDPIFGSGHAPFQPGHDSGAILVGAGCSPGGTSTDRSRLAFSNYGSTLDLQGWGENVCTCGYGALYAGTGPEEAYTATFNGTSSASPIVAAACAELQAAFHAATGWWLTPARVRDTLRNTGSPQQSGMFPATQNIGPRPNLIAAAAALGLWGCPGDANWSNEPTPGGLVGRRDLGLAYDSARGRVLLFGGSTASLALLGDTWAWDGSWTQLVPPTSPGGRDGVALAYDRRRERLVLFGGNTPAPSGETWEFDGTNWSLRSTSGPSPRAYHAMAYDELRERVVMLGGVCQGLPDGTWEWDGFNWIPFPSSPYSLTNGTLRPSLAWDSERQVLVAFGGAQAPGPDLGETWERSGTTWILRSSSGPSPRSGATLAYDRVRRRCVLYGGAQSIPFQKFSDTWEWDGTSWEAIAALPNAGPRTYHAAAYDEDRGRVLLFGGDSDVQVALHSGASRGHSAAPGVPFCLGDNSATPCPCGNPSAPRACRGCLNSTGQGAKLASQGVASLSSDDVLLLGSGMPVSVALYFQGTLQQAAGAGSLLGDGLLCAGGSQIRMGAVFNSGSGSSSFPPPASSPLSVRGVVTQPGSLRTYQIWYRDTTPFCTSLPYNESNGLQIVWGP